MYGPMKKRNIPVILLLPLLSLSCSLSHKMERSISKVGLSQADKRPAPDTTCYSVPEKITWKDSSGVEHIVTMAEREGGNLAASKIRNLECPNYEICLIDYGCGKFNRKIHIMEQYP